VKKIFIVVEAAISSVTSDWL